jgi:hypothetical protein
VRKMILSIIFSLVIFTSAFACDICGCGLGNYYIGMLPQFSRSFFGLRYQYRQFHTQLTSDQTQFSNDIFQSLELWGGVNIGKKWQMLAFIPYNINKQHSDDGITDTHGLGDIAVLMNYKIFDKESINKQNSSITQQLWFGGGIKIPTGKVEIDPDDPEVVAVANSQMGTGSTDVMINGMYAIRIKKIGINTTANYKLNTKNKFDYQFGNKFTANSFAYYSIESKKINFAPNIGLMYEHSAGNKLKGAFVDQTGGYVALAAAGIELNLNKVSIGVNTQIPFIQNFADGQTQTRSRVMCHVTFSL